MYNLVTRRKIARTDTSSYPTRAAQTVDAVVSLWIPAAAALLACAMTPARAKVDSRYYEVPTYPVGAVRTVDTTVRTWIPAFDAELASGRTSARAGLDVRRYEWNSEEPAWIPFVLVTPPTTAQTSPALRETGGRTLDTRRLDVRSYDWHTDDASWIQAIQAAPAPSVAQTVPAVVAAQFRTPAARPLDLFRLQSTQDVVRVPDDWKTWTPIQDHGGRTRESGTLDVRRYDWSQPAWIGTVVPPIPPPTDAQTWPGILDRGQGYRTARRPQLDVLAFEWQPAFAWVRPVVDAAVAQWAPIFTSELAAVRTTGRAVLDVRGHEWAPDDAGWNAVNFTPETTTAQLWPAILDKGQSYRTVQRPSLEVRAQEWAPGFGWVRQVVDASVATYAPVFSAELATFRTADRHRLDVRRYDWAPNESSWEVATLPPVTTVAQTWPAFQAIGVRTSGQLQLDVRDFDWQPTFTWVRPVADAAVSMHAAVFGSELATFRTPDRARIEVRAYDWTVKETAWIRSIPAITAPNPTTITFSGEAYASVSFGSEVYAAASFGSERYASASFGSENYVGEV